MKSVINDQADGLRRLMALSSGRRVTLIGGDYADIAMVIQNLAAALMQEGKDVQVVDEHSHLQTSVAPCAGRMELIHAAMDVHGALTQRAVLADHVVVVLKANAAAIQASYACIKRLNSTYALECVRVLVNGAANAAEAQRILDNLAHVGRRYLSLALEPAGWVRADPYLVRSKRLNVAVVDAFGSSQAAMDYQQVAKNLLQWPKRPFHSTIRMARSAQIRLQARSGPASPLCTEAVVKKSERRLSRKQE